jgi:hypothetical protein
MARQKHNAVMHNARGMFAKQVVFKERAGKVYLSGPPVTKDGRQPTQSQLEVQDRFKESVEYAKFVMEQQPELKARYKNAAKPGQTAYNIALKDAFNAPVVTRLFTDAYRGEVGNAIIVQAKDDFKVNNVKVAIFNSDNELIEEGPCVIIDRKSWRYTTTQVNPSLAGTKIKASAFDIPENEGTLEVIL